VELGSVAAAVVFLLIRRGAMHIQERPVGEVMILDLQGKLTIDEGEELLRDKVNSMLHQGFRSIILNLENVPFVDSAGLGAAVGTFISVRNKGGTLKLLHATKRIHDLLVITKLVTVFESFDSEADAVGSFKAG
jgi:anti-sigma B factor antagonist